MSELKVEIAADEAGFDERRLKRIDTHFARYVDERLLPGWLIVIARHGQVVHLSTCGQRDVENGLPVELDTVWRIYSMTKPITSVAAMMLYEEGAFELKDPVSRFIPAFADTRVFTGGSALAPVTQPMVEPMRVWHLLTHTSGLTYGFHNAHPVDAMYLAGGFELGTPPGETLEQVCDRLAGFPLLFQPGSEWNYSMSTDVLGRLVEVASGQSLDAFFKERIFDPLGMPDTGFFCPPEDHDKLAALYIPNPADRTILRMDAMGDQAKARPSMLAGGGGLVSTAADYNRFCQMLRGGGQVDGVRLLSERTLRYMTSNHLPGDVDLDAFGRALFSEVSYEGVGFGLGFSVVIDAVANKVLSSNGEFAWGGAASTGFWVDPEEDLTAIFMTQLLPSSTHPIRSQLRQLVYQSLVD